MEQRLEQMEARLQRAECQVRTLRGVWLATLVGAAGLLFVRSAESQSPTSKVKAPFQVMGQSGQVLLQVKEMQDEGGQLEIYNAKGKAVARLHDFAREGGGQLELNSSSENNLLRLGPATDGYGGSLRLEYGREEEGMAIQMDGGSEVDELGARLIMWDKKGKVIFAKPDTLLVLRK